jgi:alpha-tubulin suppressor-like RCC1 family protein
MRIFDNADNRKKYIFLFIILLIAFQGNDLLAQQMSTGGLHSMFICTDGKLIGSGNNANGKMGTSEYLPYEGLQTLVEGKWMMVSCGSDHTLLIRADSTLWAMGKGGLLGLGDYDNREEPTQVGSDNDWVFIEAGVYTSFGIKKNGTLWSWGGGINGQLGFVDVFEALEPMQVGLSDKWVAVAAAQEYTLGLQEDGTIWGWGVNINGELGDGSGVQKWSPVKVSSASDWAAIAVAGGGHSLALNQEGYIWGTGLNHIGQLGFPQEIYSTMEWTLLDSTNRYLHVTSGKDHTLAIRDDHTLWATGRNDFGQLGIGSTATSFGLVQVGDKSNWEQVTAYSTHSLALTSDHNLYIWGKNKDWEMPSCAEDGSFQCNQPLLIDNFCSSNGGVGTTTIADAMIAGILYYPVPVQDILYFNTEGVYDYFKLTDITGRTVLYAEQVEYSIDLSPVRSGIFIVEMGKDGTHYQQRIVKE